MSSIEQWMELQREQGRAACAVENEPERIKLAVGARCCWTIATLPNDPPEYKRIAAIACIQMQTFFKKHP